MQMLRKNTMVAGVLTVLCVSLSEVAASAQNLAIGMVDDVVVGQKFEKFNKAISDLNDLARDLDSNKMPAREFLDDNQGKRFDALVMKVVTEKLSDGETKELKTLVDAGTNRRTEWTGLVARARKTDAEAKRIEALQSMAGKNSTAVTKVANELYNAIKTQQEKIEEQHTTRANDIIKNVASGRKLALVVRKTAVIWNSDSVVDITDEVVKQLNK